MRGADLDLVQDLQGRSQRLSEDRPPVADIVGHDQQISRRQAKIFSERAVPPAYSERGSIGTVAWIVPPAKITLAAPHINLANDALSDLRTVRGFLDDTDKLMSERAAKIGVTARDLDVRVANSRHLHPNQRLAVASRDGRIDQLQFVVFKAQRFHHFCDKTIAPRFQERADLTAATTGAPGE